MTLMLKKGLIDYIYNAILARKKWAWMAKVIKNSAIKIIKWDILKRFDGEVDLYTGNGVHLLAGQAKRVPRWWSMTLTLTLSPEAESSNELEVFKSNFRPDTKLAFAEILAVIAEYVKEGYTDAQIERVVSGEIVAVVCASKPK